MSSWGWASHRSSIPAFISLLCCVIVEVIMDRHDSSHRQEISLQGNISGQVAIGDHIHQSQTIQNVNVEVTQADLQELHGLIEDLKQQIAAGAAPELKDKALERACELEEAITAGKPDLTTMEYVRDWFVRNLPKLSGAVTALVVHPLVGRIVEVAGEAVAQEFRRRFGIQ